MLEDYYNTKEKKVKDFFKGFFLNICIAIAHFLVYWLFFYVINILRLSASEGAKVSITVLLGILIILIEYLLIKHFFKKRRYIAIGMLAGLILPLLVTGFCSMVFSSPWTM